MQKTITTLKIHLSSFLFGFLLLLFLILVILIEAQTLKLGNEMAELQLSKTILLSSLVKKKLEENYNNEGNCLRKHTTVNIDLHITYCAS